MYLQIYKKLMAYHKKTFSTALTLGSISDKFNSSSEPWESSLIENTDCTFL